MSKKQGPMSRKQLRAVFKRNYGSANQLAIDVGVNRSMISLFLRGYPSSERVEAAVRERAIALLATEKPEAA
jgi:hypothetical protein